MNLNATGIALGITLGCVAHAAALIWLLARFGLWQPDWRFAGRLLRILASTAVMSLGLTFAQRLFDPASTLALMALCGGGLALYGLAAWLTGAVTREDWSSFA